MFVAFPKKKLKFFYWGCWHDDIIQVSSIQYTRKQERDPFTELRREFWHWIMTYDAPNFFWGEIPLDTPFFGKRLPLDVLLLTFQLKTTVVHTLGPWRCFTAVWNIHRVWKKSFLKTCKYSTCSALGEWLFLEEFRNPNPIFFSPAGARWEGRAAQDFEFGWRGIHQKSDSG